MAILNSFDETCLLDRFTTKYHNSAINKKWTNIKLDSLQSHLRTILELLKRINFILFCFNGKYVDVIKRCLRIQYLTLARSNGAPSSMDPDRTTFKLIGCLELIQTILSLYANHQMIHLRTTGRANDAGDQLDGDRTGLSGTHRTTVIAAAKPLCLLCTGQRRDPALLLCGHVFCWHCILNWLLHQPHSPPCCPVCRQPTQPNLVIYLNNYNWFNPIILSSSFLSPYVTMWRESAMANVIIYRLGVDHSGLVPIEPFNIHLFDSLALIHGAQVVWFIHTRLDVVALPSSSLNQSTQTLDSIILYAHTHTLLHGFANRATVEWERECFGQWTRWFALNIGNAV